MKQFIFSLSFCLLTVSSLFAQGIQFESGKWADVKAKAKAQNKPIFVDAYAVWCGPCKWMSANSFTDASVGELYNAAFINYKFDMEKGEGPTFASQQSIRAYPTLLIFSPEGQLLKKVEGARDAEGLIDLAKPYVQTNNTRNQGQTVVNDNWEDLNSKAWEYYETKSSRSDLNKALNWAEASININRNWYNLDTKAHLLAKLGRDKEALELAVDAILAAQDAGELAEAEETMDLLRRLRNN
ncbi:thioredoxin family protein [Saprospira sp. CCB-QB6]|uniref:thioredoxin family protein n=1 Tax=Saprospira sp. CCB-QB6 TaxID=3023936 RepID=UPI0023490F93|nr:thioredoxin family protein [Saprospira sp. CCB-QB6]WCL82586.1 thioredoxin family protein [Saprospira sp. CCB-QB6]